MKRRNVRVDATLGFLIAAVFVLVWVTFDIGKRVDILTTNISTLTSEVIK